MLNRAFRRRILAGLGALAASMVVGVAGAAQEQPGAQGFVNVEASLVA